MDKKQSFDNRRKFQRVRMQNENDELSVIIGAKAVWPGEDKVDVFDMSHSGAAVALPSNSQIENCATYDLEFEVEGQSIVIASEVMWFNEKMVGLNFQPLSTKSRVVLTDFLTTKLIGANLVSIDAKYFAEAVDFDHWLQGPADTNLYIWMENQQISRVYFEMGNSSLEFANGKLRYGEGEAVEYSNYDRDGEVETGDQFVEASEKIKKKLLDILSQVKIEESLIQQLMSLLISVK